VVFVSKQTFLFRHVSTWLCLRFTVIVFDAFMPFTGDNDCLLVSYPYKMYKL